jgi:hypothetical protein
LRLQASRAEPAPACMQIPRHTQTTTSQDKHACSKPSLLPAPHMPTMHASPLLPQPELRHRSAWLNSFQKLTLPGTMHPLHGVTFSLLHSHSSLKSRVVEALMNPGWSPRRRNGFKHARVGSTGGDSTVSELCAVNKSRALFS